MRAPTRPNNPVSQNATVHQFRKNTSATTASAMKTNALCPTLCSPRHNGCQSRNKPKWVISSGCTQGLSTPSSSAPCNNQSIASNNQRLLLKYLTIICVSISALLCQYLVKTS